MLKMIPRKLIFVSMCVYLILNAMENIIHFNIGRNIENKDNAALKLQLPGKYDIAKIIVVMTIFSMLQGIFTYYGLLLSV